MKTTILLATFCIYGLTPNAQTSDLSYIHSAIEGRFNINLDTTDYCGTYILNGVPFDKEGIENELKKYKRSDIKFTGLADMKNMTWHHTKCDLMILVGAGDYGQKKEKKLEELESIRTNLNDNLPEVVIRDYVCKLCKQVVVDGTPVHMYDARTLVNELKPKDIDFIVSYESANPAMFGRNSVNGLTEIFLRKKVGHKK